MIKRDYSIDLLRMFGTMSVIMAHVKPPELLYQIRAFDVVLLVIISGMSYSGSSQQSFFAYVKKRIKRLLIPTYKCITTLFLLCFVACLLVHKEQLYDFRSIFFSYILSDHGMGYIWIVKVYLIISLFNPFIYRLDKLLIDNKFFLLVIALIFVVQYVFIRIECFQSFLVVTDYLNYILPYCALSWIGIRWKKIDPKEKLIALLFSSMVVFYYFYYYGFIPNTFKYPADIYYIFYGLIGSIICIYISHLVSPFIDSIDKFHICEFLSVNSFTIYLSHIVVMLAYNFFSNIITFDLLNNFYFHYIVVLIASVFITIVIKKLSIF